MEINMTAKIDRIQARRFWHNACSRVIGACNEGEIEELTVFGGIALGRGLTTDWYKTDVPDNSEQIVRFLREWADAMAEPPK